MVLPDTAGMTELGRGGRGTLHTFRSFTRWHPVAAVALAVAVLVPAGAAADATASAAPRRPIVAALSSGSWSLSGLVKIDPQSGRHLKRLARGRVRKPLWSPDGKKIIYAKGFENNLEIALVTRDGSRHRQLTDNHKLDQWPSWAPESKRFVVERLDAGYSDYDNELVIVKADGSGERNLTSNKRHDICPSWSPDGKRIAFYRRPSYSIYTIRPDGSGERRLTSGGDDGEPLWSPDGRELLFDRHIPTPDGDPTTEEEDLFIVNRRGTKVRRVTRTPEAKVSYAWSPDGSKIAFIAFEGAHHSLWVINRDGSNLKRIGTDAQAFDSPTWSKGGTRIAYGRGASGDGYDIGIARADGSGESRLTTTRNASEVDPTWHSPAQQCSTGY